MLNEEREGEGGEEGRRRDRKGARLGGFVAGCLMDDSEAKGRAW